MKLYLIRHGKTIANERHLYCGKTDLSVSEQGIKELQNISYHISEPVRFVTSGMLRTEQTLTCLFGEVPHTIDERFREVNFGVFEMHSYEDLKACEAYQVWISGDNEANIPPEGESGNQMKQRVLCGLQELQKQEEDVVLVTHGGVIACLMEYLFPNENKNRFQWRPKPGGGYLVTEDDYTVL